MYFIVNLDALNIYYECKKFSHLDAWHPISGIQISQMFGTNFPVDMEILSCYFTPEFAIIWKNENLKISF